MQWDGGGVRDSDLATIPILNTREPEMQASYLQRALLGRQSGIMPTYLK